MTVQPRVSDLRPRAGTQSRLVPSTPRSILRAMRSLRLLFPFALDASSFVACGGITTGSSSDGGVGAETAGPCGAGQVDCPRGGCTDLATDLYNCGSCSLACIGSGQACVAGQCTGSTPPSPGPDGGGSSVPPNPGGPAPSGNGSAVLAISKFFYGDTDRSGIASPDAWRAYGLNIDGKVTTRLRRRKGRGLGGPSGSWPDLGGHVDGSTFEVEQVGVLVVQLDVDEVHAGRRVHHVRALHVGETEARGAGERGFAMRLGDALQRGSRHLARTCCAANIAKPAKPRMPTSFAGMVAPYAPRVVRSGVPARAAADGASSRSRRGTRPIRARDCGSSEVAYRTRCKRARRSAFQCAERRSDRRPSACTRDCPRTERARRSGRRGARGRRRSRARTFRAVRSSRLRTRGTLEPVASQITGCTLLLCPPTARFARGHRPPPAAEGRMHTVGAASSSPNTDSPPLRSRAPSLVTRRERGCSRSDGCLATGGVEDRRYLLHRDGRNRGPLAAGRVGE